MKRQAATRQPPHPYADLKGTPIWKAVNRAIGDLEKNQDVTLTTARHYVVGYICQQLAGTIVSDPGRR